MGAVGRDGSAWVCVVEWTEQVSERLGWVVSTLDVVTDDGLLHRTMSVAHKVQRTANAPKTPPDELETSVAQALIDLENNVPELKAELRPLQISAAREVDVRGGKKTIVIFVPVPQLKAFRKVQQRHVVSSVCRGLPRSHARTD